MRSKYVQDASPTPPVPPKDTPGYRGAKTCTIYVCVPVLKIWMATHQTLLDYILCTLTAVYLLRIQLPVDGQQVFGSLMC